MFRRIREFFAAARGKQNAYMVNLMDMFQANRPLADLWDVRRFNDEGYRRNAIIFACVVVRATAFSEPSLDGYAESREGELSKLEPEHMLSRLIYRPNKRQSQSAFMRAWSTHLDVAGNAYALKVRAQSGMPVQLRLLQPDLVRPVPDKYGEIIAYEYGKWSSGGYDQATLEAGRASTDGTPQVIPASEVVHEIAYPDPLDPYRGLSPIAVLARMGDLDNYAADYLRAFFLNAGIPSGMLKFKTQVDKSERDKAREQWKSRYSSTKGWWDLFVTDTDVEYQEIGSKIKTMDLGSVFGETESRICATFHVPAIMVGALIGLEQSTYSNYEQAERDLYRNAIKPLWANSADRFTVDLASEFGPNIELKFDLSGIDALQEDKNQVWDRAIAGWETGLIKKNEARKLIGQNVEANDGGDVYKVKTGESFIVPGEEAEFVAAEPSAPFALHGVKERLALPAASEQHDAVRKADWKLLHRIADSAAPGLKKKFSRR